MLDWLLDIDKQVFIFFNGLGSPILDQIMIGLSNKYLWTPLYLFLIFVIVKEKGRDFYIPLLAVLITLLITDQITANLMKPYFARLRPCHDPTLEGIVNIISDCKGKFGFASGHAANSLGLATFFLFWLNRPWTKWLLFWAILVAYSRVYLGVHYPSDILVGGAIGIIAGYGITQLSKRILKQKFTARSSL